MISRYLSISLSPNSRISNSPTRVSITSWVSVFVLGHETKFSSPSRNKEKAQTILHQKCFILTLNKHKVHNTFAWIDHRSLSFSHCRLEIFHRQNCFPNGPQFLQRQQFSQTNLDRYRFATETRFICRFVWGKTVWFHFLAHVIIFIDATCALLPLFWVFDGLIGCSSCYYRMFLFVQIENRICKASGGLELVCVLFSIEAIAKTKTISNHADLANNRGAERFPHRPFIQICRQRYSSWTAQGSPRVMIMNSWTCLN